MFFIWYKFFRKNSWRHFVFTSISNKIKRTSFNCKNFQFFLIQKDMLLNSSILEDIFGEDIIFILMTFCGPIQGMNLRNLTWHGFLTKEIFPIEFSSFLMILILSLFEKFNKRFKDIPRRKLLNDEEFVKKLNFEFKICNSIKKTKEELESIKNLVNRSKIIPEFQKKDWNFSFRLFFNDENYNSLIILFPILEHL